MSSVVVPVLFPSANIFRYYVLSSTSLGVKMMAMSFLTSKAKMQKNVISTPEDVVIRKNGKVTTDDPDVERVRRAHQNDLENIPAFWIIGQMFLFTEPTPQAAQICFFGFMAARFGHSFFYLNGINPWRSVCYMIGQVINFYMAAKVLRLFF